jgi:hypothetical protein
VLLGESNVLFREDCFAVYLINEILFDDLGMKYLKFLLGPIFKKVIEHPTSLQIGSRCTPEESQKNTEFILKLIEEFIENLNNSIYLCPV